MVSEAIRSLTQASSRPPSIFEFGLVTCLWLISIVIVNPIGEFPIIDDGLYEGIVKHLLVTGEFPNPEPASATLLTNILWGAAFCLMKGVSFTTLRVSTLVASLLGLFGVLALSRELALPLRLRLLTALTLAFSPAYHSLSFSFMTDVPFAALVTWASVFFVKSLRSGSLIHIGAATLLTVVATLSRQVALAMPISYAISLFFKEGMRPNPKKIIRAAIALILPASALSGYFNVLASTHRLPITYNFFSNIMMSTLTHGSALAKVPFINAYVTVLYLGLFLLPVLLAAARGFSHCKGWLFGAFFVVSLAPVIAGALIRSKLGLSDAVPLPESHVLVPSGIGLLWLRGAQGVPGLPREFWDTVTCLAMLGSVLFFAQLSAIARELVRFFTRRSAGTDSHAAVLFFIVTSAILLCPYLFTGTSDRYLTPALPLFAVAVMTASLWWPQEMRRIPKVARTAAYIQLIGTTIFSVIGTRDYLAWHKVVATASSELIQTGHIRPQQINGGEEFNAYYPTYQGREAEIDFSDLDNDPSGYVFTEEIKKQAKVVERIAWRPPDVQYVVGFEPMPGYATIREYAYYNWMPPHQQSILVLRRNQDRRRS